MEKTRSRQRTKQDAKKTKSLGTKEKKDINSEVYFTVTTADDGTKDFTCTICQHVFKKRQNFSQHYKHVHLKQRPKLRSCHMCDVKVPAYMRAFHMEEHGLPAPSCGACGKKFSYPFQVLQHQKYYHMGERKFACEFCDLRFRSRYGLTKHTIKHTGERSFKCDFCDKGFKWKNNLRIHLMMHLNDKRHVCTVCEEAFVQTSSLKYHIVKRHPDLV
nr:gastrula zinc finger protein XlCGF8.2DB-like [Danaus plexippus plexippus]